MSPRVHAALDYATVIFFAAVPTLLDLSSLATTACYVLAAAHLVLTVTTRFPGGVLKLLPFRLHGAVELTVAILLPTVTVLGGAFLQPIDRFVFGAAGAVILLVYVTTDYADSLRHSGHVE